MEEKRISSRKVRVGKVVSDKMDKTVVVAIADPKKGEQLVLFTTEPAVERGALSAAFKAKGVSELAVPKTIRVVEELPLMGTGKVDYVKLKEMAAGPQNA